MSSQRIILGKISGVFGVQGALKIFSFTDPHDNIFCYPTWKLEKKGKLIEVNLVNGKQQGKMLVARLQGITDRDLAINLVGSSIQIDKTSLPKTEHDEYYWHDLVGLKVKNLNNEDFGIVESILETGANDVLIVKGDKERLIPFVQPETVVNINLDTKIMRVNWDADF